MRPLPMGEIESAGTPYKILASPLVIVTPPGGGGDTGGGGIQPPSDDMGSMSMASYAELEFYVLSQPVVPDEPGIPKNKYRLKSFYVTSPTEHGLDVQEERYMTGYFSPGLFGGAKLKWLDSDLVTHEASSWTDIPDKEDPVFYSLVYFEDSPIRKINASFTATLVYEEEITGAVTEHTVSATFYLEVTNNWDAGNRALREITR